MYFIVNQIDSYHCVLTSWLSLSGKLFLQWPLALGTQNGQLKRSLRSLGSSGKSHRVWNCHLWSIPTPVSRESSPEAGLGEQGLPRNLPWHPVPCSAVTFSSKPWLPGAGLSEAAQPSRASGVRAQQLPWTRHAGYAKQQLLGCPGWGNIPAQEEEATLALEGHQSDSRL